MQPSTNTYTDNLSSVDWPDDAVFVVDDALPPRFAEALEGPTLEVESGESLKTLERVGRLAESVLNIRSTRPMTLIGVGGGSIGDAVGFVASTLWRGVGLWHVPTTLLAMVDSAHGGKTAVNLGGRKNQLGTFYPAEQVVVCTEFLEALPLQLREQGLVELLKALWLAAPEHLESFDDETTRRAFVAGEVADHQQLFTELIDAAITAKTDIVAEDPREQTGHRRILNLGHTAGHALEAMFQLPHGRAVGWGLAACAVLSCERAGLDTDGCDRLLDHLDPLLVSLPRFDTSRHHRLFADYLRRDKKREGGQLVSILLDGPGQPVQTRDITAGDWFEALCRAVQRWNRRTLTVCADRALRDRPVELPVSKSHANRALTIAHLRPGPTRLELPSRGLPTDVADLQQALRRLDAAETEATPVPVQTGEGGTTTRFLMAVAALRSGRTSLRMEPAVRNRPHEPLAAALRDAGASVEPTAAGLDITGFPALPRQVTVDASTSSQFASALALLAASGREFSLRLDGEPVSRPYFALTLEMLRGAGVAVEQTSPSQYRFAPTNRLEESLTLTVPRDTSAAVVWQALNLLDERVPVPRLPDEDHPDARFGEILRQLTDPNSAHGQRSFRGFSRLDGARAALPAPCGLADRAFDKRQETSLSNHSGTVTANLSDAPDLAPVLAAVGCRIEPAVIIEGAAHLRRKESNRIDGLARAFARVGVKVEPREDGLAIPPGCQQPDPAAEFNPHGDHRLAMAAVVLSFRAGPLAIPNARCVAKSYPELWRQLRRIGFRVAPCW